MCSKESGTTLKKKDKSSTGYENVKRRPKTTSSHRTTKDWYLVKYFILKELLRKSSFEKKELLDAVNARLREVNEVPIKKPKLDSLLQKLHDSLSLTITKESVDLSELAFSLLQNSKLEPSEQLKKIAQNSNDPTLQILKLLWRYNASPHNDIFDKLKKLENNRQEKLKLVNKVFRLLNQKNVHHVIISTGVTMFELARKLIDKHDDSTVKSIVSSNILILLEFLLTKMPPAALPLKMLPGLQYFRDETASLGPERPLTPEEQKSDILKDVQASVLSFTSLSYKEGFKIGLDYPADTIEKIICLRPPHDVLFVIITIDWDKILSDAQGSVVIDDQGRTSYELFDFSNNREYIIVTNRPDNIKSKEDKARQEDLQKWAAIQQITVIDSDDNLQKYLKNPEQYRYV